MNRFVKNFAKGTVGDTYSSGDTSITLATGHGSRFPDPATDGPFFVTWWNATDYADPADDPNREICLCTARTGDILTLVRGQDGTTASSKNTAGKTYKMLAGITASMWNARYSLSESTKGLVLRTHPDESLAGSRTLFHATSITMNDGEEVRDWESIVTDITINGVGGLDTGAEETDQWYEQYAIYNGTTKAGCLHRAPSIIMLLDGTAGEDATQGIRSATDNSNVRVGQGFVPVYSGRIPYIDVKLIRVGTVSGNIWFTLESDGTGGAPSGTVLGTTWQLDASRIPTTSGGTIVRFPFHRPYPTVSASIGVHVVAHGSWSVSSTNYIGWRMDGSGSTSIPNGSKSLFDSDTETWTVDADDDMWLRAYLIYNEVDFATTVPSGYRYAFLGYVYNGGGSDFFGFTQIGRSMRWNRPGVNGLIINEHPSDIAFSDLRSYLPPRESIMAWYAITGTGAATGAGQVAGIRMPDLSNANAIYAGCGLYSGHTASEVPGPPAALMTDCAAIYSDCTNGADLILIGYDLD